MDALIGVFMDLLSLFALFGMARRLPPQQSRPSESGRPDGFVARSSQCRPFEAA
jgi:hypothetical protein